MKTKRWQERLKQLLAYNASSVFRTYLSYAPVPVGAEAFWHGIVRPYFWHCEFDFVARTRFGSKLVGNTREGLQRDICYFGVWEPHLTCWIQRRLAPGDVFVDVGANVGYFSLLAAGLVANTGKVVAIEASPSNYALLCRNLERNQLQNVRAVNAAASDEQKSTQLFRGPDHHSGWTTVVHSWADEHRCVAECEVQAAPLTSLLQPGEVSRARLIKVDVEGAEWEVAAGMKGLLSVSRADLEIVMEVTPSALLAHGKTCEGLLAMFAPFGFKPYQIDCGYSIGNLITGAPQEPPRRVRDPITQQVEIIWSRTDAEYL
jgi:FkbM family methyltransferase